MLRHAAVCWLSTSAIFPHPSILRNVIWPLATRLKSRISAASSLGREPCVFTRRRKSSRSRSSVCTNTFTLTPGFRAHLGANWYLLVAVEVPVTSNKAFDCQVLGGLMEVF